MPEMAHARRHPTSIAFLGHGATPQLPANTQFQGNAHLHGKPSTREHCLGHGVHTPVKKAPARNVAAVCGQQGKADSTLRSSQAVPHPSTNRALRCLTSEVERDPVHSTRYGRRRAQMCLWHKEPRGERGLSMRLGKRAARRREKETNSRRAQGTIQQGNKENTEMRRQTGGWAKPNVSRTQGSGEGKRRGQNRNW